MNADVLVGFRFCRERESVSRHAGRKFPTHEPLSAGDSLGGVSIWNGFISEPPNDFWICCDL